MTDVAEVVTGTALAARAREAWGPFRHGAVAHVGLSGLRRVAPSGWTFGGLVAHVAAWHDVTAERFARYAATGEMPPPPADEDAFNAAAAATAAGKRPSELLAELDASFGRVTAAAERLSAQQVEANRRWAEAVFAGNTSEHYDEHREEFRTVRPRSVEGLLARYDADWEVMRAAVQRLVDEDRLGARASDAWRLRDVVAHMNGWLLEALRVLPDYVAGRPHAYTSEGIDRQNAEVVAARRNRTEADVIAELDEAGRALRSALAGLAAVDIENRRTLGIIAACSYLHWDEHLVTVGADV